MLALSRRRFLALGTAAMTLLGSAIHAVGHVGKYPALPFDAVALGPKTVEVYRVIGDFLIPPGGPLPGSGGDPETLRLIDAFMAQLPDHHRMLLEALALAYEHGTALDRFGARRLTAMPAERQHAYLTEWAEAPDLVRAQLFTAVKMVWNMSYFERTDVQAAMGIAQPCKVLV